MRMVSMMATLMSRLTVTVKMVITRCRGVCSSSSRPVACVPTKTSQKVVTMAFRWGNENGNSNEVEVVELFIGVFQDPSDQAGFKGAKSWKGTGEFPGL